MSSPSTTSTDVDALFKLPLGEFTAARNALAAQLKKAGQQSEANEAKALPKPSVSAWVVNQLFWRHREPFDRLLETGDRLRRAQTAQRTGNSVREALNARREAVTALIDVTANILSDGGYSATRDIMRRVTSTLEALSAYGSLSGSPSPGRLTEDVEPPGFETLAGLLPASGATKIVRTVEPQKAAAPRDKGRQVAAARDEVRTAERALGAAHKHAERAAANLKAAEARAKKSDAQRAKIEKELARATKEAEAAQEQARAAEAEARQTSQAAESAEQALKLARSRLEQVVGDH